MTFVCALKMVSLLSRNIISISMVSRQYFHCLGLEGYCLGLDDHTDIYQS